MTADHRSIVPNIPGVPWWAAVVVAVTGTAAGFAFDAGSGKEFGDLELARLCEINVNLGDRLREE